ncbi:hypothetical protein [Kibdelosporangium phytohabitans]|uniref:Uncharacterized protein n=1 Tax=Kibdelosporangium phytohabitans TaxID=860235 RepID=A0A0N9I4H8_9PSEU|nr:hypothetical protein [Kibdelosporangium phytohabitans]ALG12844.1 hypothetical protein AOZ06_43665 [Kibdelosporangium phytohabitans]MBE1464536.1 hypothetical protein [Kibdelosporangium phytohabitans]
MLYLVLLLVVASLGLLIAALTTANTLWAWISVLISVVAAVLLVLDWIKNRRSRSQDDPATGRKPEPVEAGQDEPRVAPAPPPAQPDPRPESRPVTATAGPSGDRSSDTDFDESFEAFEQQMRDSGTKEPAFDPPVFGEPPFGTNQPEPVTAIQDAVPSDVPPPDPVTPPEPVTAIQQPVLDDNVEPLEENTDATDLLVVSELQDEVVVIDERPRYHLSSCAWLGGRPVLALPVSEARDLGFTPCSLCSPDSTLAARQRARS